VPPGATVDGEVTIFVIVAALNKETGNINIIIKNNRQKIEPFEVKIFCFLLFICFTPQHFLTFFISDKICSFVFTYTFPSDSPCLKMTPLSYQKNSI
jgi:hypothetical protein